jgi:hypothetical protein
MHPLAIKARGGIKQKRRKGVRSQKGEKKKERTRGVQRRGTKIQEKRGRREGGPNKETGTEE